MKRAGGISTVMEVILLRLGERLRENGIILIVWDSDWNAVKEDGIEFAFICIGRTGMGLDAETGRMYENQWLDNTYYLTKWSHGNRMAKVY